MSYRDDPVWQAAQQAFINPGAATADQRLLQSIGATVTMWAVELAGGAAK